MQGLKCLVINLERDENRLSSIKSVMGTLGCKKINEYLQLTGVFFYLEVVVQERLEQ